MSSSIHPGLDRPALLPSPQARDERSSLGVRVRALVHSRALDRQLAGGADPGTSRELARRAQKITSRSYRRMLANSLDAAVSHAEGRQPRFSAVPPMATREIRASRAALLELARSLRSDGAVSAEGVALAQDLVTDGSGPLFMTTEHDALWRAARRATEALRLTD
jgi:hypothetical protein